MTKETVELTKEEMNELNDVLLKVKTPRLFPLTEEQVDQPERLKNRETEQDK